MRSRLQCLQGSFELLPKPRPRSRAGAERVRLLLTQRRLVQAAPLAAVAAHDEIAEAAAGPQLVEPELALAVVPLTRGRSGATPDRRRAPSGRRGRSGWRPPGVDRTELFSSSALRCTRRRERSRSVPPVSSCTTNHSGKRQTPTPVAASRGSLTSAGGAYRRGKATPVMLELDDNRGSRSRRGRSASPRCRARRRSPSAAVGPSARRGRTS